jgi:bidirectional [NiFe] hydrogenase diaphorase subunit
MQTDTMKQPAAPPGDPRWKLLDAAMRRHGRRPNALIESLHAAQEAFGYLDEDSMRYVAANLRVPLSKVFGVATFYHFFTLKPQGDHTCVVCTGTACYIKGAPSLLASLEEHFGVGAGETSRDGMLSVLTARCFGCCGLAPAVVIDGNVAGKLNSAGLMEKISERMKAEKVTA